MEEEAMEIDDELLEEIAGGQVSVTTLNHEQMMVYRRLVREYKIARGHGDMEATSAAKQKIDDYLHSLLK